MICYQNLLDDRLNHPNSAVVMACIQLVICMTKDMEELTEHVYKRIKGKIWNIRIIQDLLYKVYQNITALKLQIL